MLFASMGSLFPARSDGVARARGAIDPGRPCRSAPVRIVPVRSAPARSAPVNFAPLASAPARKALLKLARFIVALIRVALVRSAPARLAPARLAPVRLAPASLARKASRWPAALWRGRISGSCLPQSIWPMHSHRRHWPYSPQGTIRQPLQQSKTISFQPWALSLRFSP